ncbi:translation initiation factor IF-2 [Desulfoplanes formicivorans]|uniref:Translation initiation factor IF-2 n=1 Tax=Desulfoplanes formicivorans TaxID=1592317 RepID=A0A194ALS6_9BACT|nr:translation initiation factor IF-2 [Desulfoplanes formicivorans]GAU09614.1 translation initiation factor IF-2 [Desulfoplanes formicivorans]
MTTKMRVRELSGELGISNKELIHLLRKLNINVKSHMSGLTDEETEMARKEFNKASHEPSIEDKRVRSGVIVRRKKKPVRQPKAEPADTAVQEEPPVQPTSSQSPTPSTAAPVSDADDEATPSIPTAETEQPEDAAPETATDAPRDVTEEVTGEVTEDADASVAKAPVQEPSGEASQPESGEDDEKKATEKKRGKRKKSKKKKAPQPAPQVKIISRPDPAKEQPAPQPASTSQDKKKKSFKKKHRRTVEADELYRKVRQAETSRPELVGSRKGRGKRGRRGRDQVQTKPMVTTQPIKAAKRKIRIDEAIRIADLAQQMGIKAQDLIKNLIGMGVMATINQSIDADTAAIIAADFGYDVEKIGFSEKEFLAPVHEDKEEDLRPRPPVVTIMGHVDHGKTSLLDVIRKSHITSGEAGGITQHIGAYHVTTPRGEIVFLDTPGHEAFTAMRARGAQVTDLVILVVAADDGVMDQTREAINHSKAAGVPIVVAVNKIDKEGADPDRVKRELAEHGLVPEEWGGDTIFANVSAKKKIGIDELLELVLLQAEVLELKANPNRRGVGHIVEARLDKGRGAVATVLIQAGTIHKGDAFTCGLHAGKIRAILNDQGKMLKEAGPAMPVEVQGFDGVPDAGDEFVVVADEKVARKISDSRKGKQREKELAKETKFTLDKFLAAKAGEKVKVLNLVVKSDVQGSQEAIIDALNKLSGDEVRIEIIHSGTGAITESDILLASASNAIIIGFNVRPTAKVKDVAEQEKVEIRFYNIIYKLVAEIKDAMSGMLAPTIKEVYIGQAEVRQTFNVPKVGTVAGCAVIDGKLVRNAMVRLLRDGVVIYTGKLNSLKRFKDDVREVQKGFECGTGLERFNDIKEGDIIEAFEEVEEKRTL